MDTLISSIATFINKLTIQKVLIFGLLVSILLIGWFGYVSAPYLLQSTEKRILANQLMSLTPDSKQLIDNFMKKYKTSAQYAAVLRFEFSKNTRVPVYRKFNSTDIERLIVDRLNGADGALPIFIKGDHHNNDQMIHIMQSEFRCDPYNEGGISRMWPDLAPRFATSCRAPIPPSFNSGTKGYIVVHFSRPLSQYEFDSIRIDMLILAKSINEQQ